MKILGIHYPSKHELCRQHRPDFDMRLASALEELPYVDGIRPVQTNIVIFDLKPPVTPAQLLEYLAQNGVKASAFGPQTIRLVTHLDVTREMVDRAVVVLRNFEGN